MSTTGDQLEEKRGTLLYMLQQVTLPEAAFLNHPELIRQLNRESSVQSLVHMGSKALVRCVQIGLIEGEDDGDENIHVLIGITKQITIHPHKRNGYSLYVLTMPEPVKMPEAHFAAIVHKDDEAKHHMHESPSTRYFTLEKSCSPLPMLCEVRRDRAHNNYGEGPAPEMAAFVDAVFDRIGV